MSTPPIQDEVPWDELLTSGELRSVNLVLTGPAGHSSRFARLIFAVLVQLMNAGGRPAFGQVVVLLPPDLPDTVIADLVTDTPRLRGSPLDEDELDVLFRRVLVRRVESFEATAISQAVAAAPGGSFIVVVDCARYRASQPATAPPTNLRASEDRWIRPVAEIATQCLAQVAVSSCVLVDVGEYLPTLSRNLKALQDLECAVWGSYAPEYIDDGLMEQLEHWTRRVARGDILSALAEVDVLPGLSTRSKVLCKIQILHKGGRTAQSLDYLRQFLPNADDAAADLKLKLTTIALAGGDRDLARQLLESSEGLLRDLDLNELALELTQKLPSAQIERHCVEWLASYFPESSVLEEHRLRRMFLAARDGQPLLRVEPNSLPLDAYVELVISRLTPVEVPNYLALVEDADARWPRWGSETRLAAALNARTRALPVHVAGIAAAIDPHSHVARHAVDVLLWSIERLILSGDDRTREGLSDAVLFILRYLAFTPADIAARERLDELLSVDIAGFVGVALLAHALLRLAAAPAPPRLPAPSVPIEESDEARFTAFVGAALQWLSDERAVDLSKIVLPVHLLSLPADTVLRRLKQMVQYTIEQEDADDVHFIKSMVIVAFAVAPHATRRDDDLDVLRLATSRLVVGGEGQLARDLVEAGLAATHGRPERLRLAWYAYGDVFHRVQNRSRALMAFGCALATGAPVELERAYYETMGIVRALRDTDLLDAAHHFLRICEQLLIQIGVDERMANRIETVRLGLKLSELSAAHSSDGAAWSCLLQAVDANLQDVLRSEDELAPILILAVQVVRRVEDMGIVVDTAVRARIQAAGGEVGDITTGLVQIAANVAVGPLRLLELAQAAQRTRYADDVGFDVRWLVHAARAQLSEDGTLADPTMASFAAELTTDHAISLPGAAEGTWLPSAITEPATVLQELSRQGINIEVLALDSQDQLVRVTAAAGEIVVHRETDAFSLQRLHTWSLRFPFEYGLDRDDPNVFYTSMQGLGLSQDVGDRALFVLDTRLQRLPPQLLLVQRELLGQQATIAVAPSLTWLRASVSASRTPYGPASAWISTAVEGSANGTLAGVAERVADHLQQYGVALQTGAQVPDALRGAHLAIVAAHGGLADDNRFFKVISNEAQMSVSAPELARALEGAGVVVLFVCSGGRQDEHPVASTTVGLPKQLLDRGSAAVIASPWSLDSRVPSHWLPAFLAAWEAGERLIDANAAANRAVATQMGDNPAQVMAMTLYGNPFLRRRDLVD